MATPDFLMPTKAAFTAQDRKNAMDINWLQTNFVSRLTGEFQTEIKKKLGNYYYHWVPTPGTDFFMPMLTPPAFKNYRAMYMSYRNLGFAHDERLFRNAARFVLWRDQVPEKAEGTHVLTADYIKLTPEAQRRETDAFREKYPDEEIPRVDEIFAPPPPPKPEETQDKVLPGGVDPKAALGAAGAAATAAAGTLTSKLTDLTKGVPSPDSLPTPAIPEATLPGGLPTAPDSPPGGLPPTPEIGQKTPEISSDKIGGGNDARNGFSDRSS